MPGNFAEAAGGRTEMAQRSTGFFSEAGGLGPGSVQAQQRGIGAFLSGQILAGGLAQFFGGLGHVQDIIDHLKS